MGQLLFQANKAELLCYRDAVCDGKNDRQVDCDRSAGGSDPEGAARAMVQRNDIRAKFDVKTGDFALWRCFEWLDEAKIISNRSISSKPKKTGERAAKVGDFIVDPLPEVDLGPH